MTHYDLFSCIVHYGRAGSGHYITYGLNNISGQWFEFDDDIVRPIDPNVVQNAEAYVLFYRFELPRKGFLPPSRILSFSSFRKKESNLSETYETIRHLLSTDEVRSTTKGDSLTSIVRSFVLQDNLLPYYISRYWINRLFYFAEPGGISNEDFLCKHGGKVSICVDSNRWTRKRPVAGVYPSYWSFINDLVTPVPESVWRFLSEKFVDETMRGRIHLIGL